MSSPAPLSKATIESWLEEARVDYYTCDRCEGMHLQSLQDMEGIIDSRLFLEPWGLLLTTELEIRPMALLPLAADLGRLNMDYPTLKLFQDVVDDATPQLVIAGTLLGGAGASLEQFATFVASTVTATRGVGKECLQLNYLFAEAGTTEHPGPGALH
ncbi:MAG: YbjN domain-containing protein [Halioglobus sp.]